MEPQAAFAHGGGHLGNHLVVAHPLCPAQFQGLALKVLSAQGHCDAAGQVVSGQRVEAVLTRADHRDQWEQSHQTSQSVQELVTLIVAQRNGAAYAWVNHLGYAKKSGLSEAVIAALEKGQRPDFDADLDDAVFDFTTELLDTRSVGDAAYQAVLSHFGEAGTVELVSHIGFYVMTTLSLNAFRAPVPGDAAPPFGG